MTEFQCWNIMWACILHMKMYFDFYVQNKAGSENNDQRFCLHVFIWTHPSLTTLVRGRYLHVRCRQINRYLISCCINTHFINHSMFCIELDWDLTCSTSYFECVTHLNCTNSKTKERRKCDHFVNLYLQLWIMSLLWNVLSSIVPFSRAGIWTFSVSLSTSTSAFCSSSWWSFFWRTSRVFVCFEIFCLIWLTSSSLLWCGRSHNYHAFCAAICWSWTSLNPICTQKCAFVCSRHLKLVCVLKIVQRETFLIGWELLTVLLQLAVLLLHLFQLSAASLIQQLENKFENYLYTHTHCFYFYGL